MKSTMYIPIKSKIYLKNRQLIEVKDLKVGDELLSLRVDEFKNKNIFQIISEYLNHKINHIDEKKLELSSTYVTNINIMSNEKMTNSFLFFDQELIHRNLEIISCIDNKIKLVSAFKLIDFIENQNIVLVSKLNNDDENNTNSFIKSYQTKIEKNNNLNNQKLCSIETLDNHLLFTENFIILGGSF